MTALALSWFEDEGPRDLRRWAMAAVTVVAIHVTAIGSYMGYLAWYPSPPPIGDEWHVDFDLTPAEDTVDQPEVAPVPETAEKQVELPPPDDSQTVVAPQEEKPVEKNEEQKPPTPAMPARVKGGAPRVDSSWQSSLIKHLQQYKRYPGDAQSRGEEGIVMLSFSVDRNGHVLARQVVRSSGYPQLDEEVISMIQRAEPLPPFPASMTEPKLDLTVPIRFSLR